MYVCASGLSEYNSCSFCPQRSGNRGKEDTDDEWEKWQQLKSEQSKLFDVIAAIVQESDYAFRSAHVRRAGYHEVGFATL